MDTVWIKHPRLPDNPPAEVPDTALAGWQQAGWEQTDPPPPLEPEPDPDAPPTDEQPTDEAPADAGASAFPESPRRRRARTEESK
jgi:hypothetical protein